MPGLEEGRCLPIRLYCAWARVGSRTCRLKPAAEGEALILGSWAAESVLSLLAVYPMGAAVCGCSEPAPPALCGSASPTALPGMGFTGSKTGPKPSGWSHAWSLLGGTMKDLSGGRSSPDGEGLG